jgi:translation initiation factor 2B subunit (eIF-2B alpha/beta/delta family)
MRPSAREQGTTLMEIGPLIEDLRKETGASTSHLVELGARMLVAFTGGYQASDTDDLQKGIALAGRRIVEARPDLAPLFHLVTELYALGGESRDLVMVRRAIRAAAVDFTKTLATREEKIAEQVATLLGEGAWVATLGRSERVERALTVAASRGVLHGVLIGEGRPAFDGRKLAESLAGHGDVEVKVFTDAALVGHLGLANLVLISAGAVRSEGVLARSGAASLAHSARHATVPVYAIAGVMRMLPGGASLPDPFLHGPQEEVWENPPEGVGVVNALTEIVPLREFNGIVSETGSATALETEQRIRNTPVPPWAAT